MLAKIILSDFLNLPNTISQKNLLNLKRNSKFPRLKYAKISKYLRSQLFLKSLQISNLKAIVFIFGKC